MDKYQIVETTEQFNHAGTKATADISVVAEKMGFQKLYLKMRTTKSGYLAKAQRQVGYYIDWNNCYQAITEGSVVLLQHPFHYPQLTRDKLLYKLKKEKKVKFISVVHDVEELRAFRYNDYYKREFEVMLDIADVIIVHNQVMLDWFVGRGVPREKLVNLKLFDYLIDAPTPKKVDFERSINIAGNLDVTKCGYISQLGQLEGVKVNLYGPNFDEKMRQCKNVVYHGSFPVAEIPNQLNKGFGLVWDGDSIDGCKGLSGQYLRYNNPHKMSLYIASGLPIVIWKEAAQAKFVEENGIGICVRNLYELNNAMQQIAEDEYGIMSKKVKALGEKVVEGKFTQAALLASEIRF
ncbi:hypothetical protein ACTM97_01435 [Oliverpabstia intestinalis]|uniref:hypothetical protein n=1 Tax=Oliverpabstia intestinalis TaxID=2606633 RepID=UPI003F8C786B